MLITNPSQGLFFGVVGDGGGDWKLNCGKLQ
jgi:hypothetical protein